MRLLSVLQNHLEEVHACRRCPDMVGPVVTGHPVASPVLFVGQAPGPHEGRIGRPFAWTAGKNLFRWTAEIGLDEAGVRGRVYMAAVCRCFPGKTRQGGDRVPSPEEVSRCAPHLDREVALLAPRLVVPIGRLAIEAFLGARPLAEVIGRTFRAERAGQAFDVIPLPHPSGASTWWKLEPGATLLQRALRRIARHPAWREILAKAPPARVT
jgi:uracil-DNA glycosylase